MSKDEVNKARFIPVLSDGLTDAGIRDKEIVYFNYILKGRLITQFAHVKNPDKAQAS